MIRGVNMKRVLYISIVFLFILSLCGCKNDYISNENTSTNNLNSDSSGDYNNYFNTYEMFKDSFKQISKKDINFVIYESEEHAGNFYEIFDNNGNFLDEGYHSYRGSFDISKNDNIVRLEYGFSGTNVFPQYRFYDIEKSKVSRYFGGPIAIYDNLIAYCVFDKNIIIVQDIFDVDKAYKELKVEFSDRIFLDINEIHFSNGGKNIIISYYDSNSDYRLVEQSIVVK